jgi:hypothetical protein
MKRRLSFIIQYIWLRKDEKRRMSGEEEMEKEID